MSNTTQFKQILVDVDNYNALKDLGKAGDSFNEVVRGLLSKRENQNQESSIEITDDNLIEINPDNESFILKIDSGLRKVGVDRIIGLKGHLEIDFLNDNGVEVFYPKDVLKIPDEVESALLNSDMRLLNYAIKRIVEYFHENIYKVKVAIGKIH